MVTIAVAIPLVVVQNDFDRKLLGHLYATRKHSAAVCCVSVRVDDDRSMRQRRNENALAFGIVHMHAANALPLRHREEADKHVVGNANGHPLHEQLSDDAIRHVANDV